MKRATIGLVVSLCLSATALRAGERPIASLVPADSFVAVLYDGGHPGFRETSLHAFFREPEVAVALKQLEPLWQLIVKQMDKERGRAEAEQVLSVRRAVRGSEIIIALAGRTEEKGEPAMVMAFRIGGPGSPTLQAAETMQKAMAAKAKPGTVKELVVAGHKLRSQVDEEGARQCFGVAGAFFVVATQEELLRRALDPATPKLALPPDAEHAVLRVLYDHQAMLKTFGDDIAKNPDAMKVLNAIGLNDIQGASLALVPRGKRLVSQLTVQPKAGGKLTGLAKWLADSPPVDRSLLAMVPRDVTAFYATSLDLGAAWDEVWAMIGRVDPEAAAQARKSLAEFETKIGAKVREGLLAPLGRGSVFMVLKEATFLGGAAIVIQRVRDSATFEKSVERIVGRLELLLMEAGPGPLGAVRTKMRAFTYRGHRCRYLWVQGPPSAMMLGNVPCYTRIGDVVVFSTHPLHLKSYLDFLVDKGKTIRENPEYRGLEQVVPARASLVGYGAWPDTVVSLYNTAAPFLMLTQMIEEEPARGLDLANLPSSRLIRRYAKGAVVYAVFEQGRYRFELQGDGLDVLTPHAPAALVPVAAAGMVAGILAAQREARAVRDRNNLNQLAKGLATYLNEFGDNRRFPSGLGELFDKGVIPDKGVFVSPLDKNPPKLPNGLPCSYVSCFDKYPKRQFLDDFPPNAMLAWTRAPFVNGKRHVMFFDSHVELVDDATFGKLLKELDELVKKHTKPRGGRL